MVKSLYICVSVYIFASEVSEWKALPKRIQCHKALKKWWNTEHLGLRWRLIHAGRLWCGTHMGRRGANRMRVCVCTRIMCVWACVCAGGAECPLLSKQQKCHPLPGDWCGRWRFDLIRGPDSKTGAMLLSLLFLSPPEDVQHPGADTGGQCAAKQPAAAEQNKWLNWEGRMRFENREEWCLR